MSLKINILICTIDDGIQNVYKMLEPFNEAVEYKISHQYRNEKYKLTPENLIRKDVSISQIAGMGLSRNRNNALKMANGDIAVIADDDVKYLQNSFEIIMDTFIMDPKLDVTCFKIKTPENETPYKNYPTQSYRLKKRKHHPISSIEIAFRVKSIKEKNILFDERFGLGSSFLPAGEESVFINDCIAMGLKVVYFPYYIINHSLSSTVNKLSVVDPLRSKLAAAFDAYAQPYLSIFKVFLRTIKYLPDFMRYKKSPFKFLFAGLSGVFIVLFSKKP